MPQALSEISIQFIKGVGPAKAKLLANLGSYSYLERISKMFIAWYRPVACYFLLILVCTLIANRMLTNVLLNERHLATFADLAQNLKFANSVFTLALDV